MKSILFGITNVMIDLKIRSCLFQGTPESWASAGEGKRGLLPPLAMQNSIFLVLFRQIVCFCPPPPRENFALLWKKVCGRKALNGNM